MNQNDQRDHFQKLMLFLPSFITRISLKSIYNDLIDI
jgi:hypothetical protein